jgi:hemerythrin-like domain-containing protein
MKTTTPVTTPHAPHEAASPITLLVHEHEVILRALALLERLGRRLESGDAIDQPALAWLLDFFRTFADRCHHAKEEAELFPALERHGLPRESGPLGVMLEEHEAGRALVRAMADGDARATAKAIREYVALLRAHIDKENTVLFPLAEQLLSDEEQRTLMHAFEAVEQAQGLDLHERLLAGLTRLEGD